MKFSELIALEKLVVVDFSAKWCRPCKAIAPRFESLKEKYPQAIFVTIDIEEASKLADYYKISSIPTFILFRNNEILDRMGGVNMNSLENLIKKHLKNLIKKHLKS